MLICRKRNVSDVKHRVFAEMSANSLLRIEKTEKEEGKRREKKIGEKREETENERDERKYARESQAVEKGEGEERDETDHVGGGSAQRLRKTHKQAYYNNGRACCTNTISA